MSVSDSRRDDRLSLWHVVLPLSKLQVKYNWTAVTVFVLRSAAHRFRGDESWRATAVGERHGRRTSGPRYLAGCTQSRVFFLYLRMYVYVCMCVCESKRLPV
jgi:hypothetical protein